MDRIVGEIMEKRHFILYYIMPTTVGLILVGLAIALPPPVDQKLGAYDTLFSNLVESNCRGCHATGVADTHHNLVVTDIPQNV